MKYTHILAACAFMFSAFSSFAEIDAERIRRDVQVMAGEIEQPIKFNNQNRSFRDKNNREYEYRDADVNDMSRYQYQDDLLNIMFDATKNPADLKAFEGEILKHISEVKDANTKCELVRMLEFAGSEKSFAPLKKLALGDDETLALVACGALEKMQAKGAGRILVEIFNIAKNQKVKEMALYAAAKRGDNKKFVKKQQNSTKFASVAKDGSKVLIPTGLDKFQQDFLKNPSKAKALEALKSSNEWEVAFVAPYIARHENSLMPDLQTAYNSASPTLKAWIVTRVAEVQNEASKKFVFENLAEAKEPFVCVSLALALEKIGGKAAVVEMIKLRDKTRGGPQAIIAWSIEGMNEGGAEIDAYIVEKAKDNDSYALRLIGLRSIDAKPVLFEKLNSSVWNDALASYEILATDDDVEKIIEFAKQSRPNDKQFVYRLGFVVRNAAIRTSEPKKFLSMLENAFKSASDELSEGLKKCYFLALMECGDADAFIALAKKVAEGKADKIEISQLAPFAKRLTKDYWRRMPDHKKYEQLVSEMIAGEKCGDAGKSALEKSLGYIKNRGEEPKR